MLVIPDAARQWPDPATRRTAGEAMIDIWEVAAHRLFAAVTERFCTASESGPTLMVAEDIHWAGVAALRLLDHVLSSCANSPVLVVATARSSGGVMPAAARGALSELCARLRPHIVLRAG